ncbi:hypothetical protein [Cesiribacter sp. SM1]|uniref:hypothetical protein n=1 Tax=Cesiribacter sp. SM1 TaxID=2861196 RepID=UPI001CD643C4|nr:hypothetical protein [Cesiribacter sp. SM1]
MGRYSTSPILYDEVRTISITNLKKWGYLEPDHWKRGALSWGQGGKVTSSISIIVDTTESIPTIILSYTSAGRPINYEVQLVSVPSNLGVGELWYFRCPKTGKRCRKLYYIGGYFLHRLAFQGCMYERQTYSKAYRDFGKVHGITLDDKFMKLYNESKKPYYKAYYKGKPTKRYERLIRLGKE